MKKRFFIFLIMIFMMAQLSTAQKIPPRQGLFKVFQFGKPIKYVEQNKIPPLTEDQRLRGFALFTRPDVDMVFPNTIPDEKELIKGPVKTFATPGEYEAVIFNVLPLRDLKDVRVVATPLISEDYRGRIQRWDIDIRKVRCLERARSLDGGRPMTVPLVLEEGEYWDIPAGETSQFYVTYHILDNMPAGLYKGHIVVVEGEWNSQRIDVELEVLPFKLREPQGISWGFTTYEYLIDDYYDIFLDQRAHGMNAVKFEQMLGSRMRIENGEVVVDFDGSGFLERVADVYKEIDFSRPMLWAMSGEPEGHYDPYTPGDTLLLGDIMDWCMQQANGDEQSDMFEFCYRGVVEAVLEESAKRGWKPMIWQPCNEPLGHHWDLQDRTTLRALKILKSMGLTTEENGMRVGGPGPYDKGFPLELMNLYYPFVDIFAMQDGPLVTRNLYDQKAWDEFSAMRKRDGDKKVWFYNFDYTGYDPEASRFIYGYGLWISKCDGIMQWTYRRLDQMADMPVGTPRYEDIGSLCFSYPATERQRGGPTVGFEAIREGVDDYKYLYKFFRTADMVKKLGTPEAKKRAEELEKSVNKKLAELSFDKVGYRPRSAWQVPLKDGPDGTGTVSGKYKLKIKWDFGDYQAVRKQAAYGTAELLKMFNEKMAVEKPNPPFNKIIESFPALGKSTRQD